MTLQEVKLKFPNDYDLGTYVRDHYKEIEGVATFQVQQLVQKYTNNFLLGERMRNYYQN